MLPTGDSTLIRKEHPSRHYWIDIRSDKFFYINSRLLSKLLFYFTLMYVFLYFIICVRIYIGILEKFLSPKIGIGYIRGGVWVFLRYYVPILPLYLSAACQSLDCPTLFLFVNVYVNIEWIIWRWQIVF